MAAAALPSAAALTPLASMTRLSPSVVRFLGLNPGPFTLQGTNTYLLSSRVLIDTGAGQPDYKSLLAPYLRPIAATQAAQQSGQLTVICTHWHADHVGGWKQVAEICRDVGIGVRFMKVPSVHDSGPDQPKWEPLDDGDIIDGLRVVKTPGHTEDHICLWYESENILFSGDCVLGQGTAVFEDLKAYMASLGRILQQFPSLSTILPGHGPVVGNGAERIASYISHRKEREEQVLNCLPASLDGILSALYPNVPDSVKPAAKRGLQLHLNKLKDEEKIGLSGDGETWSWKQDL
ncbi:lactamase, beta 2 [Powellomyces hirtus]|nr:lactamase, beta 2 [Powellomyces hirtus]